MSTNHTPGPWMPFPRGKRWVVIRQCDAANPKEWSREYLRADGTTSSRRGSYFTTVEAARAAIAAATGEQT